jgi:GNAT superfamily N-acetyltransferase
MPRHAAVPVTIRAAVPADLADVLTLRAQNELAHHLVRGRRPAPAGAGRGEPVDSAVRECFQRALADPDVNVQIARVEGQPAGVLWAQITPLDPLSPECVMLIDQLVVGREYRRRGLGRALLEAATAFAETRGVESAVVWANPGDREGNRYLARLGFAPLVVRRIAPVQVLRRKLAQPARAGTLPVRAAVLRRPSRGRVRG